VLKKREIINRYFANFDFSKMSKVTDPLANIIKYPEMIKHKQKIIAIYHNALVFNKVINEYGSFYDFLLVNYDGTLNNEQLTTTYLKLFKTAGFKFIGPSVVLSYIQALGLIDAHEENCHFKQAGERFSFKTKLGYCNLTHFHYEVISLNITPEPEFKVRIKNSYS